jgi:hypothetical protein
MVAKRNTPETAHLWDQRVRRLAARLGLHAEKARHNSIRIDLRHLRSVGLRRGCWYISDPRDEAPVLRHASTEDASQWLLTRYLDRLAAGETFEGRHPALVRAALAEMAPPRK